MPAPDPSRLYPDVHGPNYGRAQVQQVVFLKALCQHPLTSVGEYTYYADADDPTGFERHNVRFHYGPERLIIGKYCALAAGIRFIMNAANHERRGISTFPFPMLGDGWLEHMEFFADRQTGEDTVVGNDVWFGYRATVMPGVTIGDGAIVAAGSVVASDVAPYTIVGGNPARPIKQRFTDDEVERLLRVAWWDWPVEAVSRHIPVLMRGDVDGIEEAARAEGLLPAEGGAAPASAGRGQG